MATQLTKNLVRVSTEKVDEREIIVTLTEDQQIELKLKGKRGKGETIYIKDLFAQLYGIESSGDDKPKKGSLSITRNAPKKGSDRKMISLYDLRSHNAISLLDSADRAKFDGIIKSLIDAMNYAEGLDKKLTKS